MTRQKGKRLLADTGEYYPLEYLVELGKADTSWMGAAKCKNMEVSVFFPERWDSQGNPVIVRDAIEKAKAICQSCPVIAECRQYAIDFRLEDGVWGGTSPTQREMIWKERGSKPFAYGRGKVTRVGIKTDSNKHKGLTHGTRSAYNQGCGCEPCRAADRDYQRQRKRKHEVKRGEARDRSAYGTDLDTWDGNQMP